MKEVETRRKAALLELLLDSPEGESLRKSLDLEVREETRESAALFVKALHDIHIAPKIMADGEGDLILFWGNPAILMVTVEGTMLHPVVKPGQRGAIYCKTESFDGENAPASIIRKVPTLEYASLPSL